MGSLRKEGLLEDMTPRLVEETYLRKPSENSKSRKRYGIFECAYCGKHWETQVWNIKRGHTKSCGCLRGDTHGLSSNIFYHTWSNMCRRCNNPTNDNYKNYGGRGITVCEEWLDIRNFIEWAEQTHPNNKEVTLDRIDVNGNYEPNNCRWVDATTQSINQRIGSNNKSGYVGVSWRKDRNKWTVRIRTKVRYEYLGNFDDLMEAVIFRDQYIIENKLPHKLNLKQEQINE